MAIQRYKMYRDQYHMSECACEMDEDDNGAYVLYEDIKRLIPVIVDCEQCSYEGLDPEKCIDCTHSSHIRDNFKKRDS